MTELSQITLEVFTDSATPEARQENVFSDIDIVRGIVGQVEIIRTDRQLRLTNTTTPFINVDAIRWRVPEADLNLIVTTRSPYSRKEHGLPDKDYVAYGAASKTKGVDGIRYAILNTSNKAPKHETAKQLAHLLGIDAGGHTVREECIAGEERLRTSGESLAGLLDAITGKKGALTVDTLLGAYSVAETFCDTCTKQLGQNAHFFRLAKSGLTVPENLIP